MQEFTTKRRLSFVSTIAMVSSSLLIGSERTGRCDETREQICNNNKECSYKLDKAVKYSVIADGLREDREVQIDYYNKSAKLYHESYELENNPSLLFSSCGMTDKANFGIDYCASRACYMLLLKDHSNSDTVITYRAYIDQRLGACVEKEVKENIPQVKWSGTFKPGFDGPIYLKNGEKPWREYVTQVEAENTDRLKKKFPHHYRTEQAGKFFVGIGVAGMFGGGVAALMGLPICVDGCRVNSPEYTLSNNLIYIGGPIFAGSLGLGFAGTLMMITPSWSKRYSEYAKFPVPSYRHIGDASVPE